MHTRRVSSPKAALFTLAVFMFLVVVVASPLAAQSAPAWQAGLPYTVNALVTYGGQTYGCLQAHTSQVGWEPATTPALWSLQSGTTTATSRPTATSTTRPTATATTRPTATSTARPTSTTMRATATSTATSTNRPSATSTLRPTATPTHTATATATSTSTATATPRPTGAACAAAWSAGTAYSTGASVSQNGQSYQAAFWTQGDDPATHSGPAGSGQPWVPGAACAGTTATRALILVDQRLYDLVGGTLEQYRALAQARRGFGIGLRVVAGIDDWRHDQVKTYIRSERTSNPQIDGVLFVGNIKLPSFYKSRNDTNFTRLLPRYYEDLDGVFTKNHADNTTDRACVGPDLDCYIYGPSTIPPHDFDFTDKGANPDPEIWTAYMPVGFTNRANVYSEYAAQLTSYLQKVIRYYNGQIPTNGRFYFVGGDVGETFELTWDAFTRNKIDFYGKPGPNGETDGACLTVNGNVCYQRWPVETYPDAASFIGAQRMLWPGEGWQESRIFLSHLNAQTYQVAEVDIHSWEGQSLATTDEVRTLTKGALLVALDGCAVTGFRQPGSPSYVDTFIDVDASVGVAYLYGPSSAIAVLGDPFWRGHYAHHPTLYKQMRVGGSYLGAAHLARMKKQYAISTNWYELRENGMEMLLGDPFMDLS
jgi:hypothetical protein